MWKKRFPPWYPYDGRAVIILVLVWLASMFWLADMLGYL
ncbi:hypothetical protein ES708_10937 [subsurface metagenome]